MYPTITRSAPMRRHHIDFHQVRSTGLLKGEDCFHTITREAGEETVVAPFTRVACTSKESGFTLSRGKLVTHIAPALLSSCKRKIRHTTIFAPSHCLPVPVWVPPPPVLRLKVPPTTTRLTPSAPANGHPICMPTGKPCSAFVRSSRSLSCDTPLPGACESRRQTGLPATEQVSVVPHLLQRCCSWTAERTAALASLLQLRHLT